MGWWTTIWDSVASCGIGNVLVNALGDDGFLKFATVVELKKIASTKGKSHGLVVLLEMVIDLGKDKSSQLALWEGLVLVESLTEYC